MFNGAVSYRLAVIIQETDNGGVHLDNILFAVRLIEIGYFCGKATLSINGIHQRNTVIFAGPVVVFTESRCCMDDTDTFIRTDIICRYHTESLIFQIGKIREQRLISTANQISTLAGFDNNGFFAENLFILRQDIGTSDENFLADIDERVIECFAYRQTQVRRQCPRGSRPRQKIYRFTVDSFFCGKFSNNPSVLTGAGGIGFSGIRNRKRSLAVSTVGGDTVITVNESLVIALLKRPHDAFHKGRIHRFVGTIIINPACHLLNVFFPRFIVAGNQFETFLVEYIYTKFIFNIVLVVNAEVLFHLIFNRETMTVPSPDTRYFESSHRPVSGNQVFDKGYEYSTVMRLSCRERRAVIKNYFGCAFLINGFLKDVLFFPEFEHILLNGGNIGFSCELFVFHHYHLFPVGSRSL